MGIKQNLAAIFLASAIMQPDMGNLPEVTSDGAPPYRGSILPRKAYKARKKKIKQQSRSRMINR